MSDNNRVRVQVFTCSKCSKTSQDSSNIRKHITTSKCQGATVVKRCGFVVFDVATPEPKKIPGIPARSGPGDALRITQLTKPAVQEIVGADIADIPAIVFSRAWGRDAPPELRSITVRAGQILEVSGDGTRFCAGLVTKKYSRKLAVYLARFLEMACDTGIPYADLVRPMTRELLAALESPTPIDLSEDAIDSLVSCLKNHAAE